MNLGDEISQVDLAAEGVEFIILKNNSKDNGQPTQPIEGKVE